MVALPYVAWQPDPPEFACRLRRLEGFEDDDELADGVPWADRFPPEARLSMNPDAPYDSLLTDTLYNLYGFIIVSARERAFIEKSNPAHVEFLPMNIFDHKNKLVRQAYYILHPVKPINCIDLDNSKFKWSDLVEELIDEYSSLRLDPSRIDPDRLIFRLRYLRDVIILRRQLSEALDSAGFTGNGWVEIDALTS